MGKSFWMVEKLAPKGTMPHHDMAQLLAACQYPDTLQVRLFLQGELEKYLELSIIIAGLCQWLCASANRSAAQPY